MSLILLAGWFLMGAVAVGCLVTFWDDIKEWLNNTAADAVERVLGYGARQRMHKAVARIDRVMDVVRNQSVVFTKANSLDTYFDKTTIEAEVPYYEIDSAVLKEISNKKTLVQEFGCNS
ncbi:hypothetical protein [Clostridium sp.]